AARLAALLTDPRHACGQLVGARGEIRQHDPRAVCREARRDREAEPSPTSRPSHERGPPREPVPRLWIRHTPLLRLVGARAESGTRTGPRDDPDGRSSLMAARALTAGSTRSR